MSGQSFAKLVQKDDMATTNSTDPTTREGELTLEEALAQARAGIFDDRLDAFMPPDMYGPPTSAEVRAATKQPQVPNTTHAGRHNGGSGTAKRIVTNGSRDNHAR